MPSKRLARYGNRLGLAIRKRLESVRSVKLRQMRTFQAVCFTVVLVAGRVALGAEPSPNRDSESLTPEAKAFIDHLDAESRIAQDALHAGEGDAAALGRLSAAAASGDAYAQFRLGLLYRDGKGVPQSARGYVSWLQK